MLNLSPLFFTAENQENLHAALDISPDEKLRLAEAKREVRQCLKVGIPAFLRVNGYVGPAPEPRFFTQGSWAYKTLNAPAHLPPQQSDVDDGAYLPISFLKETKRPSLASAIFFRAAEATLAELVREKRSLGWRLITDKPTCVRVEVSGSAHIDIPLYSIPDEEYLTLQKAAVDLGFESLNEALLSRDADKWTRVATESVLLAHRTEDWIKSDPRPVKEWFTQQVEEKGEQLRRVVRYLKAYRDWQWTSSGPSSILLMAAAAPLFVRAERRDDVALWEVCKRLPGQLRSGVSNPVETSESLTDRLGREGVEEAAVRFEALEARLNASINGASKSAACTNMRDAFGPRFPGGYDRILVASAAATVGAVAAQAAASEPIGRTKAG